MPDTTQTQVQESADAQPAEKMESEPEEEDNSYRINIPRIDQAIYSGPGYQYLSD